MGIIISRNRAYTYSEAPHPTYPDTGNTERSDGTFAPDGNFGNANYSGWPGGANTLAVQVTFDFGQFITGLMQFRVWSAGPNQGSYAAGKVEVFASEDNIAYSNLGVRNFADSILEANNKRKFVIDKSSVYARYIRFDIYRASTDWVFIDEIEVEVFSAGRIYYDPISRVRRVV